MLVYIVNCKNKSMLSVFDSAYEFLYVTCMKILSLYEKQVQSYPDVPRYMHIVEALVEGLALGVLVVGERLPTHRHLAKSLKLTVGTVSRAYAEAARRGITEGITGRGTFMRARVQDREVPSDLHSLKVFAGQAHGGSGHKDAVYDLGFIAPFEHINPSLTQGLEQVLHNAKEDETLFSSLFSYQQPRGLWRHREAGALWAKCYGYAVSPENILVCAGAQHALLTILASLFAPGDRLVVEHFSYPVLRQLARRLRLTLVPVRMDEGGMLPEALEAVCRTGAVRGVYLMPTCHNPTLAQMPLYRRTALVEVCRRHDIYIIEDDVYALSLEHRIAPLANLAPERTCFIASTSEALNGGLRIAYLCAPDALYADLERTIGYTISMAPPLMAELARQWIMDGTADVILQEKRHEAALRNELVRNYLDGFSVTSRSTGFFCWLRLPHPWTAQGFAHVLQKHGIIVAESTLFALGAADSEHAVRLALGGPWSKDAFVQVLQKIVEVLHVDMNAVNY